MARRWCNVLGWEKASLTMTTPRPWLGIVFLQSCCPSWKLLKMQATWHTTQAWTLSGQPARFEILECSQHSEKTLLCLPARGTHSTSMSELSGLKPTEPEKHFNSEKISRWRTGLQNSPHPEFCRNHCHSFWAPFSRFVEKSQLAEKRVAFSPQKFRKILGQYLKIL